MKINEFGYFAKTVADQLGTKSNTLGTWARELERCGIEFDKNKRGDRIYSDKDIRIFEEMQKKLALKHELNKVAKYIAEELKKGTFDKASEDDNAQITPSVIDTNHASITPQSHMDDFKSEIISSVLDGMKTEFSYLARLLMQPPQQVDMLPNHSEQEEKLQRVLDIVQTLQERPPVDPNTSLEENYRKLLEEHNWIIGVHNDVVSTTRDLVNQNKTLISEKMQLEKELAKWKNKPFWRKTP